MPFRVSNWSASRSAGLTSDANDFHSMLRRCGLACRDNTAAPAPSPNRQALISTPGIVVEVHRRTADFDADGQDVPA